MPRFVKLASRMALVIALLLAQQTDCAPAADREMAPHAHSTGEGCHDAAPDTPSGHDIHDDGMTSSGCPTSHGCPTMIAIAATPLAHAGAPAFADAPRAIARSLTSVTLAPDRRPPKG